MDFATSTPRELTELERARIKRASRLDGIALYRSWTQSTIAVAIRCVDAIQS